MEMGGRGGGVGGGGGDSGRNVTLVISSMVTGPTATGVALRISPRRRDDIPWKNSVAERASTPSTRGRSSTRTKQASSVESGSMTIFGPSPLSQSTDTARVHAAGGRGGGGGGDWGKSTRTLSMKAMLVPVSTTLSVGVPEYVAVNVCWQVSTGGYW